MNSSKEGFSIGREGSNTEGLVIADNIKEELEELMELELKEELDELIEDELKEDELKEELEDNDAPSWVLHKLVFKDVTKAELLLELNDELELNELEELLIDELEELIEEELLNDELELLIELDKELDKEELEEIELFELDKEELEEMELLELDKEELELDKELVCTVLVAHIMGLKDIWNHPAIFDYADRFLALMEHLIF